MKFKKINFFHFSKIQNVGSSNQSCLDAPEGRKAPAIGYHCKSSGGAQYWEYNNSVIGRDDYCLQFDNPLVLIKKKHNSEKDRQWTYKIETKQFFRKSSDKCLSMTNVSKIVMSNCDNNQTDQKWILDNFKPENL